MDFIGFTVLSGYWVHRHTRQEARPTVWQAGQLGSKDVGMEGREPPQPPRNLHAFRLGSLFRSPVLFTFFSFLPSSSLLTSSQASLGDTTLLPSPSRPRYAHSHMQTPSGSRHGESAITQVLVVEVNGSKSLTH